MFAQQAKPKGGRKAVPKKGALQKRKSEGNANLLATVGGAAIAGLLGARFGRGTIGRLAGKVGGAIKATEAKTILHRAKTEGGLFTAMAVSSPGVASAFVRTARNIGKAQGQTFGSKHAGKMATVGAGLLIGGETVYGRQQNNIKKKIKANSAGYDLLRKGKNKQK